MIDLDKIHCVGCEGGIAKLTPEEVASYLKQLNNWQVSQDQLSISKQYKFANFYQTMAFVNAIAWVANSENHHPDLKIGYNYCDILYTTHAVDGLTQNDFICAAKIDKLHG